MGPAPKVKSRFSAVDRVVAMGDVHGDLKATLAALKLSGLIDDSLHWSGGDTVLVQTGDILDRGNDEQDILDLFERLQHESIAAGGAVHVLNGNHELMNAAADFRYVTPGGFLDFEDVAGLDKTAPPGIAKAKRARFAAFHPGGIYAKKLAAHPVVLVVGDTVYAHGGVTERFAKYGIERLNQEVAGWLWGADTSGVAQRAVNAPDSPVWSRDFGKEDSAETCAALATSLKALGVKRMVVGHTVQKTITSACDQQVWRIDVGMAAFYGGHAEALEIRKGEPRPLGGG